jgi:hypothetical protein
MADTGAHPAAAGSGRPAAPDTDEVKTRKYEGIIKNLDNFFDKYPVDVCGRMATIK